MDSRCGRMDSRYRRMVVRRTAGYGARVDYVATHTAVALDWSMARDDDRAPWEADPLVRTDVIVQIEEDWCGLAAGEMLLRDRGKHVTQDRLATVCPAPCTGDELARGLRAVSSLRWHGGVLAVPASITSGKLLAYLCSTGSWAALLEPAGYSAAGHWVVIDGAAQDGSAVLVRDPRGRAYTIRTAEFMSLWRFMALVMER